MILRILGTLFAVTILLAVGFWFFTGGFNRAINFARGIDNPLDIFVSTTTGSMIRLPWQSETPVGLIDITQTDQSLAYMENNAGYKGTSYDELNQLQAQYDDLSTRVKNAKDFGNPSPYRGEITFGMHAAAESTATNEYLTLEANTQNKNAIPLIGWSLQSAVTGTRVPLPPAARFFVAGVVNTTEAVTLEPGASLVISSGASPVGVSFRENKCTGYLNELQPFTPPLQQSCPEVSSELPLTAQNIQTYGDACIEYVKNIPLCHFPGTDQNVSMSQTCKIFLVDHLSYNGCSGAHRNEVGFLAKSYRLYVGSSAGLWRDTHDIVRLLDADGRTVDVLSY
jgi:hypothetical protein